MLAAFLHPTPIVFIIKPS